MLSEDWPSIVNNVIYWFHLATATEKAQGELWYYDANEFASQLAREYSTLTPVAAYVISALSPAVSWEQNQADAITLFRAVYHGAGPYEINVGTYNANKEKAWRIASGEPLSVIGNGLKTNAFAQNILLDSNYVTVDRHMQRAALMDYTNQYDGISLTAKRYRNVESAIKRAAREVSTDERIYTPFEVQAIVWLAYRNRFAYKRNGQLPLF